MKERYKLRCAVFLILTKEENGKEYILLQKRQNTGILDGKYDVSCSGHLEEGETIVQAMIRETKEEIEIDIYDDKLKLSSIMHAEFSDSEYLLITFSTKVYTGIPSIEEPDKCSELDWFDINNLPKEIAENRKIMINNYLYNNNYSEFGFQYRKNVI